MFPRYRLGAIQKMMSDVNGTSDDEQLNHKNDLKKDILRRKAQLSQVNVANKRLNYQVLQSVNLKMLCDYDGINFTRFLYCRWKTIYLKNLEDI